MAGAENIPEPIINMKDVKVGDVLLYNGHEAEVIAITVRANQNRMLDVRSPGSSGSAVGFQWTIPYNDLVRVVRFLGEHS
jgi:hypothetical protein